ncbi:MAG: hypothetical protein GY866_05505 [Proteobacteria bacterium]|nr:hypothetical protein [Pseudomonadota bacterium]
MLDSEPFEKLRSSHPTLSSVFIEHWDTPLGVYAPELYRMPPHSMEPELRQSFEEEWRAMGCPSRTIREALSQLEQTPVLQTAHHITPTNGPSLLSWDLICLSGLRPDQLYLVAANSGVAFSNTAWSGSLSYGALSDEELFQPGSAALQLARKSSKERENHGERNRRVTLIPSRQRDQLVFGTDIAPFQLDLSDHFTDRLKKLLPTMSAGEPYSYWSAKACTHIQKKILNKDNILIFDINRVIQRYLVKVLSGTESHPVNRLLFSSPESETILKAFDQPSMFLGSYQGKKSNKVDRLFWRENGLFSAKTGFRNYTRQELLKAVDNERLCPGLFLVFFILRFINGIRCLGSFNQIEYLEDYRVKWQELNLNWGLDLKPDYGRMLTTGRLIVDGRPQWPLDMAIKEQYLNVDDFSGLKMRQLWEPIVNQLTADRNES